jgi:hypothetical protein
VRYQFRRIYGDGKTIGAFVLFRGKVEPLLLGEYFYETPRINPWPELVKLEDAGSNSIAHEVSSEFSDIGVGEQETTPDLPGPIPDWKPAWIAIKSWLRGKS